MKREMKIESWDDGSTILLMEAGVAKESEDIEFVQVKIVEHRTVKASWSGKMDGTGFRAVALDGSEFTLDWNGYDDASMGGALWSSRHGYYVKATQKRLWKRWCEAAVTEYSFIHHCTKHSVLYLTECYDCYFKRDEIKKPKKKLGEIVCR